MPIKLILIRHGESNSNVQGKFSGFQDVDLTEKGIWQAKRLARRLEGVQVDAVYCSDLKRARHTSEIIFQDKRIEIKTNPNFRERNFGEWEGCTFEEVKSKYGYGDTFNLWLENTDEKIAIPQGESLVDSNNRVMNELNKVLEKHQSADKDKTIGIVCHGGTIRIILCNILNLELEHMWRIEQQQQYRVRSCNITNDMLYWHHDQTVTDRICRGSLPHHLQRKCQAGDLP